MFFVMKSFFDGSVGRDENGDEWVTLAGIAATDSAWAQFDERWTKMLANRYPVAPYIHMIELLSDNDPFEPIVGWEFCNKQALIQDAVVLLSQVNKQEFVMAWSTINESARLRHEAEGGDVHDSAYVQCAADCMFMTVGLYTSNVPDELQEPLYVFYDRGENFLGKFKDKYLRYRTRPGMPKNPDNWFDLFGDVQDVDLPYHSGLQAADMVAWAHSRSLSEKERPFSWLKKWLIDLVPSVRTEYPEPLIKNPTKDRSYRRDWERIFR